MNTICICGAGTMGSGIAQVAAASGYATILYDLNEEAIEKAKAQLLKNLQSLIDKQKITEADRDALQERMRFTIRPSECVADLVIEAVVEKMDVKAKLFNELAAFNSGETIFATNTSSLSVSALAKNIVHPERVAGLHFFNPAPLMKLVEVVRGEETEARVMQALIAFTKSLGKTPVVCRDAPGFIVNRVARPYYIESLRLAESGLPYEVIDRLLESRGFRMGPFRLMDLIGNDVNYAVSCSVHAQLGAPDRLKPSYLQEEKVKQGELGKKSGRGYYKY